MAKSRMTRQEYDQRSANLSQEWKGWLRKDTEIGRAISVKRTEQSQIEREIEKVEKEHQKLVREFDRSRLSGEQKANGETKR